VARASSPRWASWPLIAIFPTGSRSHRFVHILQPLIGPAQTCDLIFRSSRGLFFLPSPRGLSARGSSPLHAPQSQVPVGIASPFRRNVESLRAFELATQFWQHLKSSTPLELFVFVSLGIQLDSWMFRPPLHRLVVSLRGASSSGYLKVPGEPRTRCRGRGDVPPHRVHPFVSFSLLNFLLREARSLLCDIQVLSSSPADALANSPEVPGRRIPSFIRLRAVLVLFKEFAQVFFPSFFLLFERDLIKRASYRVFFPFPFPFKLGISIPPPFFVDLF